MADENKTLVRIGCEVLLAFILIYSPLAFGSAAQVYRPPLWIASTLLLLLTIYLILGGKEQRPVSRNKLVYKRPVFAYWLFAGFLALLLVQIVPLPAFLAKILGAPNPPPGKLFFSIHPFEEKGQRQLLDWLCAFSVFFAASVFPDSRLQVRRIAYLFFAVAGFEAVYGIVEYIGGRQHIFNYVKIAYLDCATGTFVNRNHFANYLVMAFFVSVGVLLYRWAKKPKKPGYKKTGGDLEKIFLTGFLATLLLAAILLSKSRGGLASLAFCVAGITMYYKGQGRKTAVVALLILAILAVGFSLWLGADPVPTRFADLPEEIVQADTRPEVWLRSVKMIADAPLLGHGAGTFGDAFRTAVQGQVLARYLHAHNDYLEMLVETGFVGFLLLFGGIAWTLKRTVAMRRERNSRFARLISLGMLFAAFTLLIHGLTDFCLQIPANRLTFFALLGLGYLTAGRRMTR